MPDVEPGGCQMHGAARVRRRDERVGTAAGGMPDRSDLPFPDVGGELRLERVGLLGGNARSIEP